MSTPYPPLSELRVHTDLFSEFFNFSVMTSYEIKALANEIYELFESNELFPDRFMGIGEASKFTTLPIGTIYALTSKGEIPFTKKCGRLRFSERKLRQWINGTLKD